VVSKPAYLILEAPRRVIPELDNVLRPKPKPGEQVVELYVGGMHGGPLVTLHIANVTIRDIFNATSVATEPSFADHNANAPRGWFFTFDPSPPAGKSKYNWQTFFALPGDWHYGTREVP